MHLNPYTAIRLQRGAEHLHRLGPRAMAELLAELAGSIGGIPAIIGLLAEYESAAVSGTVAPRGRRSVPPALSARGSAVVNRQARRAERPSAAAGAGRRADRATLLQLAVAMIERDSSLAGITVTQPCGKTTYVDTGLLRRGGPA